MTDRHDFIGNFVTEHYLVFLDGVEVDHISAGCWAALSDIMEAAENKLPEEKLAGRKVLTKYLNLKNNHIMFWTYKDNEWWTL